MSADPKSPKIIPTRKEQDPAEIEKLLEQQAKENPVESPAQRLVEGRENKRTPSGG